MAVDTDDLLNDLLNRLEPSLGAGFRATLNTMRSNVNLDLLAQLLAAGRVDEALSGALGGFDSFADMTNGAYINAGTATASFLGQRLEVDISFDMVNQRAVDQMQQNKLNLVRQFTQEQRDVVRNSLTDGIRTGTNPKQQARTFRDSMGLTDRQSAAVRNYRRMLEELDAGALDRKLRDARFDRMLANAIREGKALDQAAIDKMVQRYGERYLKYRSEVIARTEALRAVHQGSEEAIRQALEKGILKPENMQRQWHTARDSRVRDTHRSMNGQKRPMGLPFTTGAGVPIMYPGDPSAPASETIQCRCTVSTRILKL